MWTWILSSLSPSSSFYPTDTSATCTAAPCTMKRVVLTAGFPLLSLSGSAFSALTTGESYCCPFNLNLTRSWFRTLKVGLDGLLLLYHPQHGVLPVVLCFQADQLSVGMAAATLSRGSRRICTHIPLCPSDRYSSIRLSR